MAGTQIPGAPAEGTDYDTGVPDNPQGASPYTPGDDSNFTTATLQSGQVQGLPEQLNICQRTGFKVPAGTLVQEWNGLYVRPQSFEPRHAMDFQRGVPEEQQKGSVSPEQDDTFLSTNEVSASDL